MTTRDVERIRFVTEHFNDLQGLRFLMPLGLIVLSLGGTTYFDNRPFLVLRAGLFLTGVLLMLGAPRYYRSRFGVVDSAPAYEPGELHSLSIYSPAGPISRLQGFQGMTPRVRFLLMSLGLTFVIFYALQSIAPTVAVQVDESLVRPPWAALDSVVLFKEDWTVGIWDQIHLPVAGPSTDKAVAAQLLYALCGALFLGTWIWRGRQRSQRYHLILGALLLGLSACGTFLGYFVWEDRELPVRILNVIVPLVVHLWVAVLLCGAALILTGLLDHRQLARVLKPVMEIS
jgi:hypothetical protein